uniref:Uncharacterized protein n=1 Tax=Coccidioides posadasii RMSCC 3488 TaxID=454284 RepID=A0A0J6HY60_COCPO|nr:hypothetical protein CPAG_00255 [Coccidioides posadasii RMSCC 3488]
MKRQGFDGPVNPGRRQIAVGTVLLKMRFSPVHTLKSNGSSLTTNLWPGTEDCSGIRVNSYCIYVEELSIPVPTPSLIQERMVDTCIQFYKAEPGDSCCFSLPKSLDG